MTAPSIFVLDEPALAVRVAASTEPSEPFWRALSAAQRAADQIEAAALALDLAAVALAAAVAVVLGPSDAVAADRAASPLLAWARGVPLQRVLDLAAEGADVVSAEHGVLPPGRSAGSHLPRAAGVGWALRLQGASGVVLAAFDAEARTDPDLGHALNFAAVQASRTVFVVRSAPGDRSLAVEGLAYGVPAEPVSGAHPAAVLGAVRDAAQHVRQGHGPVLLEILVH